MLLKLLVGAGWTRYRIQYIILLGIYRLVQMYVKCTVYNILTIYKHHVRTIKIARYYKYCRHSRNYCACTLFHARITLYYIIMKLKYYSLIENETCFKCMKAKVLLGITVYLAFILFHSIVYRYNCRRECICMYAFQYSFQRTSENNQNM